MYRPQINDPRQDIQAFFGRALQRLALVALGAGVAIYLACWTADQVHQSFAHTAALFPH